MLPNLQNSSLQKGIWADHNGFGCMKQTSGTTFRTLKHEVLNLREAKADELWVSPPISCANLWHGPGLPDLGGCALSHHHCPGPWPSPSSSGVWLPRTPVRVQLSTCLPGLVVGLNMAQRAAVAFYFKHSQPVHPHFSE